MSMHDLAAVRKDRPRTRRELTDDPMFPDVMGARVHHLNPVRRDGRFSPDVDVSETGGRFEVTAELPGLQEKDIHITLNDGVLIVKGEKRSDTGRRDVHKRHHCRERGYGAFRRCIGLPPEIDTDRVSARLDKGVLRIVFSKKTAVRARRLHTAAGLTVQVLASSAPCGWAAPERTPGPLPCPCCQAVSAPLNLSVVASRQAPVEASMLLYVNRMLSQAHKPAGAARASADLSPTTGGGNPRAPNWSNVRHRRASPNISPITGTGPRFVG